MTSLSIPFEKGRKILIRFALGLFFLAFWHITQHLIQEMKVDRPDLQLHIIDGLMDYLAPVNLFLISHGSIADGVIVLSSAYVDLVILWFFVSGMLGGPIRPFLALIVFLLLRQLSQVLISFPMPENMIWRDPGFPSLIVSYYATTDFFFSGHVGTSVLDALELWQRDCSHLVKFLSLFLIILMIAIVLSLRIHYISDVIASIFAAILSFFLAKRISKPFNDYLITS